MQILYLRHGRETLDAQLESLFGTSDLNAGKILTLREFITALHTHQVGHLHLHIIGAKMSTRLQLCHATSSSPWWSQSFLLATTGANWAQQSA